MVKIQNLSNFSQQKLHKHQEYAFNVVIFKLVMVHHLAKLDAILSMHFQDDASKPKIYPISQNLISCENG